MARFLAYYLLVLLSFTRILLARIKCKIASPYFLGAAPKGIRPRIQAFVYCTFTLRSDMRWLFCMMLTFSFSSMAENTKERAMPAIDELNIAMSGLKEQVKLLTDTMNLYGAKIDGQWSTTNDQIILAVKIVDERFTIATIVGLGLAIGVVPAVIFLIYLPIISCVTQRTVRNILAAR